jgi:UDP-N-acetylmuramoylalanine--D-glutamate ligase
MNNDVLYGKRVGILGFARQGQALARWLPTVGAQAIVSDQRSPEQFGATLDAFPQAEFFLGPSAEGFLDGLDLLCVSGGVPIENPIVQAALAAGIPLSNDAQLFLERCPAPVTGITGSAGKTTTTTLVGLMYQAAGYQTWVGGNIGEVLLDVLPQIQPDDRVVMELSSFQLEIMTQSPQIAAVLNVTPNHLDRHGTMDVYTQAKAHILDYQQADDVAVLDLFSPTSAALQTHVRGRLVWSSRFEPHDDAAYCVDGHIMLKGLPNRSDAPVAEVCEINRSPLPGQHNHYNILMACAIAGAGGVNPPVMAQVITQFTGVEHRLERVRVHAGVTYINDSIATAPERVQAALTSFAQPLVLLLGGKDKNLPWDEMLEIALAQSRQIITFGGDRDMIYASALKQAPPARHGDIAKVDTLEDAVHLAAQVAQAGDVVLLSPGGTSYDAYKDFAERGNHFRQLVMAL